MAATIKSTRAKPARGLLVVGTIVAAWVGCGPAFAPVRSLTSGVASSTVASQQQASLTASRIGNRMSGFNRRAAVENPLTMHAGGDLTGKVALVTGASRGIGAAIAQKLAEAGATVVGTATSERGATSIDERFTGDLKGKGMMLDVTDPASIKAVMSELEKTYGTVDILVNNAGITKDGLMMRMTEEDWQAVMTANLNSIFRMTKATLKGMTKKRWGRVISISSVVGSMGNAGQANYAAAKAGVDGFSRAVAREVGSRSITVNSVAPGFIKTDMTDKLKDEWKKKLLEPVPLGRLGTPEEIADAVLFLASPSSGYITGHTLHVNGGMLM